ncbi:MAG: DUF935 family protein, partial [Flavobacterium sp.]
MAKKTTKNNGLQINRAIVPKALGKTKSDVLTWKNARAMTQSVDSPKMFPYYNLVEDMCLDAHLTSQIQNRKLKTIGANFLIKKANGEVHEEYTQLLQKTAWITEIIDYILDSEYFGYTLIELNRKEQEDLTVGQLPTPIITLIPRQNVIPKKGIILKDYSDDKGIDYINTPEYGTWLLDFGKVGDLGLINKAIPHILFSRFAQSCWSELCEIMGIPPRVMKTNTQDPNALKRAERMMMDMGAAAWFIIDDTEKFEFAPANSTKGEVYDGLIKLCRDSISLLISGAIIGQDTKFGSKGKETSSQDILQDLVNADQTSVEQEMNDKVLPALYAIGILQEEGLSFQYDQVEDIAELWERTKEV